VWTGWAWVVFGAFAVHNLEEALAAPAYFERMAGRLPIPWPNAVFFQAGTALVTVAGLVLTIIAVRRSRPGLVTVLVLNLPIDLVWLLRYRKIDRGEP
jgi:hypothetical protein